jgi:hypothetical protein
MTGTFVQPDFGAQAPSAVKTNIQNCIAAMARLGAAFAPHEQGTPDLTVRIDSGALWVNGALVEKAAQNSAAITAPDSGNTRIDRVVIDAVTGVVSVITGTQSTGTPAAPAITSGKLPVCQVALAHSTTAIANGLITDERVMGGGGNSEAFAVGGIYMNVTGVNPGTELGYGTWAAWGTGRIPMAVDPGVTGFDSAELTAGAKTKNISHTHTTPNHDHAFPAPVVYGTGALVGAGMGENSIYTQPSNTDGGGTTGSGGSASQDVLNPVITCFFWKRTA